MDIVVDGKTISVNIKMPALGDIGKQGQGTDFAAMLEEQNKVKSEILDKGFGKYVSDMQQEKLEKEIREKILNALGLSEEDLANLPPGQRAAIEKTIQETIAQEIKDRAEQHAKENEEKSKLSVPMVAALSQ